MNKLLRWIGSGRRDRASADPQSVDPPSPASPKKLINLALQGGGAHGAFTWGVLDHSPTGGCRSKGYPEPPTGAVNAVLLADGLARGGPQEAQKRLAEFWRAASVGGSLPALQRAVIERLFTFLPLERRCAGAGICSSSSRRPMSIPDGCACFRATRSPLTW